MECAKTILQLSPKYSTYSAICKDLKWEIVLITKTIDDTFYPYGNQSIDCFTYEILNNNQEVSKGNQLYTEDSICHYLSCKPRLQADISCTSHLREDVCNIIDNLDGTYHITLYPPYKEIIVLLNNQQVIQQQVDKKLFYNQNIFQLSFTPGDIIIDNKDTMYLVDSNNYCIYIKSIIVLANGKTALIDSDIIHTKYKLFSICIYNNEIYTTDCSTNQILKLSLKGDLIQSYTNELFQHPHAIYIVDDIKDEKDEKDEKIIIVNRPNVEDKIIIYSLNKNKVLAKITKSQIGSSDIKVSVGKYFNEHLQCMQNMIFVIIRSNHSYEKYIISYDLNGNFIRRYIFDQELQDVDVIDGHMFIAFDDKVEIRNYLQQIKCISSISTDKHYIKIRFSINASKNILNNYFNRSNEFTGWAYAICKKNKKSKVILWKTFLSADILADKPTDILADKPTDISAGLSA